uniref:helix-turn-helix domain-containing protein n=1 Tax=uncultured Allisonella sp. TaxID=339338 RepID=UPI00338EA03E
MGENMTIKDVMTAGEAAKLWGIKVDTLQKACSGQKGYPPRLTEEECRKSGRDWLVTRQGMERLYGPEKR